MRIGMLLLFSSALFAQTVTSVVNPAAVSHNDVVAPGSVINIFGSSLAGSLASADTVTLSTSMGDVLAVNINGAAAPLVMVSDGQITAQVPWDAVPGMGTVTVSRGGAPSSPFNVQINQVAPAFFTFRLGNLQAMALNADGSFVAATGALGAISSHPAKAGETITFLATGLGPVTGGLASGALPAGNQNTTVTTPTVSIANVPAQVTYSGMSPTSFGVYQVSVTVPDGVPTGKAVPVQLQINGVQTLDAVTIAIQ